MRARNKEKRSWKKNVLEKEALKLGTHEKFAAKKQETNKKKKAS